MIFKPGVDSERLQPVILDALPLIEEIRLAVLRDLTHRALVVTSGAEGLPATGPHDPTSLHYRGLAVDIRTRDYTWALLATLRRCLGPGWDVIDEGTHIHIERDPKKRPLEVRDDTP